MGGLNSINQRDETLTDYNHCAELIPQEIGSQYALSCISYICTFKACNANEIQSKNKLKCIDITTTENCGSEGNAARAGGKFPCGRRGQGDRVCLYRAELNWETG